MKTPALDAPMTEAEELECWGAWNTLRVNIASRAPQNMIELLEQLSPIVDEVFELRKTLNAIWQRAEDRHYGRAGVVRQFRRGVAPSPKAKLQLPRTYEQVLSDLGMTEEQLDAELSKLNLLSPPKGGPEESNT